MPIVSRAIEDTVNQNGSHSIIARFYDQLGEVYVQSLNLAADSNIEGILDGRQADLDEYLAQREFEQLTGA